MDMKTIVLLILTTFVTASTPVKISNFSNSLEKNLGLNLSRLDDVVRRITIRKPNSFEKWMMNRSGAEATYNDKTNTIVLREKNWRGERIVGLDDFSKAQSYSFWVLASTVLHELVHADYDVLIKRSGNKSEQALKNVENWFKKNARGFNSHIAAHEFFGYTASDLVTGIKYEYDDFLIAHGISPLNGSCFGERGLKKIKARMFPDGVVEFKNFREAKNYANKFTPDTVFVKGKAIDIRAKGFPAYLREGVYQHFVDFYGAPLKSSSLVTQLEAQYGKILRNCYENIE